MIRIEGIEKEYVLDLNDIEGNETELLVTSKDNDGIRHIMWGVDTKSSDNFIAEAVGRNMLYVSANTPYICGEEFFWVVNTNKDKYKVRILPSKKITRDKIYEFDARWVRGGDGTYELSKTIEVKSNANGDPLEWECSHDGFPLTFDIAPKMGIGSKEIVITPTCTTNFDTHGFFEFTQKESDITIRLHFMMNGNKIFTKD